MNMRLAVGLTVLSSVAVPHGFALTLARDGEPTVEVLLATGATVAERTAAEELAAYLGKVADAEFTVRDEAAALAPGGGLYVGPTNLAQGSGIETDALGPEEWVIRTVDENLIVVGGRPRGTLYAVYHFLEDVIGVHWWNPWEESVPRKPTIEIGDLDRRGKPVLRYRDIYMLYGYDGGRFAAHNRLNRQGDSRISAKYGGCRDYGPPYHVHTFYKYIPPDKYFETHPEYFSLVNGERSADRKQLCLTNQDVRDLFVEKLEAYIESARAHAQEQGLSAPVVYEISQNDWRGPCQCEKCQAIAEEEGSEAGPLLDFLNYIADAIKDGYPDVFIGTLAYQYTQEPPKTIRPRDNIIIRLCDTASNFTRPVTDPDNRAFRDVLLGWSEVARNLRVWDYAVTYPKPRGLPMPSAHTYQADYQFYAEHNVEGVFTELEFPIIADMRDFKIWMMVKLLEDPYQDYQELVRTFTDGFYGPAGPMVREYLSKLQALGEASGCFLGMGVSLPMYLNFDFISEAQALFDRGEQAVGDDATLLRRVRHARLPLDRATVILSRHLMSQWVAKGNEPQTMPLDREAITERYQQTWYTEADRRSPEATAQKQKAEADEEVLKYMAVQPYLPLPEKFRHLPKADVFDFPADLSRNWKDIVKTLPDDEAESGITNRLEFPTTIDTDKHPLERYKLPMPWGLYDTKDRKGIASTTIKPEDVPGPGYHWYKMGTHKIGGAYYLYFFWSWIIQVDLGSVVDPENPEQRFEVWARIKFEGPFFPHGQEGDKNAISVERIVLVKAAAD